MRLFRSSPNVILYVAYNEPSLLCLGPLDYQRRGCAQRMG
jgi:hypothetical protein